MKDSKVKTQESQGNLKKYLYKIKLRKNIPYLERQIENNFISSTQLYKSFQRKKRNTILIPPYSGDCYFSFDNMDPEIKVKVRDQKFWEYAHECIISTGFWFMKSESVEKRLSYTSDLMTPLTRLDGEIKSVGLKIFRIIKKICDDRNRFYLPPRKIRKLIEILLNNPVEIKDECFLQLIKQIRKNPFLIQNFNEWKLLAIVASFISPSESFIYPFINFMIELYNKTSNDDVKQWAKYVVTRLLQTDVKTERYVLPCFEELKSIEDRRKIPIEVYFPNGSSDFYFFESYSTIGELKEEIIKKYNFDMEKKMFYGIYEYCSKEKMNEENFIEDKIKILDVIGSWSNEIDFLKAKNEVCEDNKFRLYFQIKFLFDSSSLENKFLIYYQCYYNFMRNRFHLSYQQWKELTALRLKIDFGDCTQIIEDHIKYNFSFETPWIDKENISGEQYEFIIEDVLKTYKDIDLDLYQSVDAFLEILQKQELFFANIFPTKLSQKLNLEEVKQNPLNLPDKVYLAITNKKIFVLDYNFKILKDFSYNQLMKWGYSAKLIIFIIQNKEVQDNDESKAIKVSFQTRMASTIVYTLNTYINITMGKEPEPNSLIVNENVTREIYENKFYKKVNVFRKRLLTFDDLPENSQVKIEKENDSV